MTDERNNYPTGKLMLGSSPAFEKAIDALLQMARDKRKRTILLTGETGTGKELAARLAHEASGVSGPFVSVNCGELTGDLSPDLLFGHVKGAFTGAERSRKAVFEEARNGTLFLDEIQNLSSKLQSMLLSVVERREVRKLGGEGLLTTNFRLIVASNEDLRHLSAEGRFRRDLYWRFSRRMVELPPLRARGEDVLILLMALLARELQDQEVPSVPEETRRVLLAHRWPGNVRELEGLALQLVDAGVTDEIRKADVVKALAMLNGGEVGNEALCERRVQMTAEEIARRVRQVLGQSGTLMGADLRRRVGAPRSSFHRVLEELEGAGELRRTFAGRGKSLLIEAIRSEIEPVVEWPCLETLREPDKVQPAEIRALTVPSEEPVGQELLDMRRVWARMAGNKKRAPRRSRRR